MKVIPNSSKNSIGPDAQGRLIVRLAAPPVEGKANKELVRFLAKKLGTLSRQSRSFRENLRKKRCCSSRGWTERPYWKRSDRKTHNPILLTWENGQYYNGSMSSARLD